jgi:hypothetical protein
VRDVSPFPEKTAVEKPTCRRFVATNLTFWFVCLVYWLVLRVSLGDIRGVAFFFPLLAIGFSFISAFDFLSSLPPSDEDEEDNRFHPDSSSSS